jgi:MFS family permease
MIGTLGFAGAISSAVVMPITGWLADRYHPIRVVTGGLIAQLLIEPLGFIWLFWHPTPKTIFYVLGAISVCLRAPITSLVWVMDPPLFMRVFPRERYGQFGSANSMCRSLAGMVGGLFVGIYLDVLATHFGQKTAYCLLPLWSTTFYMVTLFCMLKFYRSWKCHGGDDAYVPPVPAASGEDTLTLPVAPELAAESATDAFISP